MSETIKVTFEDGSTIQVAQGATLAYLASQIPERPLEPLAAVVNDELQELDYPLFADSRVIWLDFDCDLGRGIYKRSSIFVLKVAAAQVFPQRQLWVSHSLGDGLFCWLDREDGTAITPAEVASLEEQYMELVNADLPISHTRIFREDGAAYFRAAGNPAKAQLIENRGDAYMSLYTLEGISDYLFGRMVNRSGLLGQVRLQPFEDGFVLHLPPRRYLGCENENDFEPKQLHAILNGYHDWSELLHVETVADLNNIIDRGEFKELMLIAENLQERTLHSISDSLYALFPEVRLILLAGPSSSGKTTTTQRLKIQFRTLGINPLTISMDDYFVDRDKTPLMENGKPDFEGIAALNLPLFNQNMNDLLAGKEVCLPRYDFITGKSIPNAQPCKLSDKQIIIVEGIHALNDQLSAAVDDKYKRKIFVSALTQLNFDQYMPVGTSDSRLFRRMVRDMQFRGMSPGDTLLHWDEVRRGEHHNIFPYQENADYYFNSTLIYELSILRPIVEAALLTVPQDHPRYLESKRLLRFIRYFKPATEELKFVPFNSILREFLGGGVFDV